MGTGGRKEIVKKAAEGNVRQGGKQEGKGEGRKREAAWSLRDAGLGGEG